MSECALAFTGLLIIIIIIFFLIHYGPRKSQPPSNLIQPNQNPPVPLEQEVMDVLPLLYERQCYCSNLVSLLSYYFNVVEKSKRADFSVEIELLRSLFRKMQ